MIVSKDDSIIDTDGLIGANILEQGYGDYKFMIQLSYINGGFQLPFKTKDSALIIFKEIQEAKMQDPIHKTTMEIFKDGVEYAIKFMESKQNTL